MTKSNVIDLDKEERKQDLALLYACEEAGDLEAKKALCKSINCPWSEYLRILRKYRFVIKEYRRQKKGLY